MPADAVTKVGDPFGGDNGSLGNRGGTFALVSYLFIFIMTQHGGGRARYSDYLLLAGCFHCLISDLNPVNISNILTSRLKMCVCVWRLFSWLSLGIYIS